MSKTSLEKTLKYMKWFVQHNRSVDPSEINRWIEALEETDTGHRMRESDSYHGMGSCNCRRRYIDYRDFSY